VVTFNDSDTPVCVREKSGHAKAAKGGKGPKSSGSNRDALYQRKIALRSSAKGKGGPNLVKGALPGNERLK